MRTATRTTETLSAITIKIQPLIVGRRPRKPGLYSTWANAVSVYGPVATGAEWAAAKLGGTSLARITFWLKLEEALAFGAVMLALDRMLRSDSAMRLRAHLLWSANPLLLWEIVAGGHTDGLAAAFGLLGVASMRTRGPDGPQPHFQEPPGYDNNPMMHPYSSGITPCPQGTGHTVCTEAIPPSR